MVNPNFPLFRRRLKTESELESGVSKGTIWFDLIADISPFILGDVFLQIDPDYVAGVSYGPGATLLYNTIQFEAAALAWHGPVKRSIGARVDRRVQIYRPAGTPIRNQDGSRYWASTHENDQALVLANGTYSFGPPIAPASFVPAGFASYYRPTGEQLFGPAPPGMTKPTFYFVYLPPLPGYTPLEGDAVISEDGARFWVIHPYSQEAGVVGAQMVVDRVIGTGA